MFLRFSAYSTAYLSILKVEEADHALVAAVLGLELLDEVAFALELDQVVKAGGLLLDRIGQLAQSPILGGDDLTAVLGDDTLEFAEQFLRLDVRQNRSGNENGFVMIHNRLN